MIEISETVRRNTNNFRYSSVVQSWHIDEPSKFSCVRAIIFEIVKSSRKLENCFPDSWINYRKTSHLESDAMVYAILLKVWKRFQFNLTYVHVGLSTSSIILHSNNNKTKQLFSTCCSSSENVKIVIKVDLCQFEQEKSKRGNRRSSTVRILFRFFFMQDQKDNQSSYLMF